MANAVIFSGGTAFRETATQLARLGRAITYIITTFDSGGSSQALREAFAVPAVGDLRNRLLAIAQNKAAAAILNKRLHVDAEIARIELANIDLSELLAEIDEPARSAICADLQTTISALPPNFHPARASLGNMAIVGAWLQNGNNLLNAVRRYGELLQCVGKVVPICEANLHLAAKLRNGTIVPRQNLFASLTEPIEEISLVTENGAQAIAEAEPEALEDIQGADLVFYPMGSFYSSILPNFLPLGVAQALVKSSACKIFIPNVGSDAEAIGLTIAQQARVIIRILSCIVGRQDNLIDEVLGDISGKYAGGLSHEVLKELDAMNIQFLPAQIVTENGERHNPLKLANAIDWMLDFEEA